MFAVRLLGLNPAASPGNPDCQPLQSRSWSTASSLRILVRPCATLVAKALPELNEAAVNAV